MPGILMKVLNTPPLSEYDKEQLILAFIMTVTKQRADVEKDVVALQASVNPLTGEDIIEAYTGAAGSLTLAAVLVGISEEDFRKYGPPEELVMSKEEVKRRGFNTDKN